MATGLYIGDIPIGKVNIGIFSENGYDTSSANITENDLLLNRIGFGANGQVVGKIPLISGGTYTSNQTISTKNKYLTSDIVINVPASGITPSGTIDITTNGTHNVTNYANAKVNVPASGTDTSDATLSSNSQMLNGYTSYSKGVKYTGNIPTKTGADLTASGATVTIPSGYYATQVTKSVATTTQATPTIAVDSAGLISASATQSAGYVAAGTKTGTKQLTTQAGETVTVNKTLAVKGKYMTGDIVVNVPASGITPSGTINITTNGTHDVTNYANAAVNVSIPAPKLEAKTVNPSTTVQTITSSTGYDGLSSVTVNAMPTGALNAPTINTSTGVITTTVGTSGYLASGTSKTLNLTTKGTATITPTESAQTIPSGRYLTGIQTIAAIPNTYIGSAVKVQNFGTGSTLPSASGYSEGDLFLIL